jgi:hypothetical protein
MGDTQERGYGRRGAIALGGERLRGRATLAENRPSGWPFLVAVASFEERMYELGSEALAEQERQVAEVRGERPFSQLAR